MKYAIKKVLITDDGKLKELELICIVDNYDYAETIAKAMYKQFGDFTIDFIIKDV